MSIIDFRITLSAFVFLLFAILPIIFGIRDQCLDRKSLDPILVFLATGALICYGSVLLITSGESGYALFVYYYDDNDRYTSRWFQLSFQATFVTAKCFMYLLYSGRVKAAFKNTIYRLQTCEQSVIYFIIMVQACELIGAILVSLFDILTFNAWLYAVAIIVYYTFDLVINILLLLMFEKRLFKLASAGLSFKHSKFKI